MISIRNTANCDFGQKLLKDIKIKKELLVDNFIFKRQNTPPKANKTPSFFDLVIW